MMDRTPSPILSRLCAVVLAALLLAVVGTALERQDIKALEELTTYDALRAHYSASIVGGYWAWFAVAIILGLGYLALVEGMAYALRLLMLRR